MIDEFIPVVEGIRSLVSEWEARLSALDADTISTRRNSQGRTIRQITGHMVDSASNNLHRIVHLQYCSEPLVFPNYATDGNNDRWIAIQNFQEEDWGLLVGLWKFSNLHIAHVIENIDPEKLDRRWIAKPATDTCAAVEVSMRDMVADYLRHLKLHLNQIEELL